MPRESSGWRSRVLRRPRFLRDFNTFTIVTTILLYAVAVVTLLAGVVGADEWRSSYVSTRFLVTVIIVPFLALIFSYTFQVIALFADFAAKAERVRQESKFLRTLDRSHAQSKTARLFFTHLLDEWVAGMERLEQGVVTVQANYWSVCSQLYEIAKGRVECTSLVPLEDWASAYNLQTENELYGYLETQKSHLLARGIPVRRTFLLSERDGAGGGDLRPFFDLATRQLGEGFAVWFVDLTSISDPAIRATLMKDFALIDDQVVMLGRFSHTNQHVYNYDFYELPSAKHAPRLFEPAMELFKNPTEVIAGASPSLRIEDYRQRIDAHPAILEQPYQVYSAAFKQLTGDVEKRFHGYY